MPADNYSASLVSRFAVPSNYRIPQGYYRSKLFIAPTTPNSLIAAAGPLFSLLERLCVTPTLPAISHIRDNIEHELHAYVSRLTGQAYPEELIVISHYLLCATIDELLGKNYIRLFGKAAEFNAFTPLSTDEIGPERRFFEIVHFIKERTNQYLDLLELAYYCLIAGFEGEQHLRPDGRQVLDNLIEEIYQLIQQNRVYKPHRLFKEKKNAIPDPINHKPMMTAALLAVGLLATLFLGSHTLLEYKAKTVLTGHAILASLDH